MTDRYIDLDETQIYGPYSATMIEERVAGLRPEFSSAMLWLAAEIRGSTEQVGELLASARGAAADVRESAASKGTVLARGVDVLGRFSTHLDAHPKGAIDRKRFFPEDGTAGGVGRSAPRVLLALSRIAAELVREGCEVRERDAWLAEVCAVQGELAPVLEHSQNARTERRAITPELEAARAAWLETYRAAKLGVECVLRLAGKTHMMPAVFHDLAVPSNAKVTEPPPAPPAEPEDVLGA